MEYTHIFAQIAAQNHTTVEEVRREMEHAMLEGYENPDPGILARWASLPRQGDIPTPEELIEHVVRLIECEQI